jgi:hypothetical protein
MDSPIPHPFNGHRAVLVPELHQIGRPLDDSGLAPQRTEQLINRYGQPWLRVFALDEEAGVDGKLVFLTAERSWRRSHRWDYNPGSLAHKQKGPPPGSPRADGGGVWGESLGSAPEPVVTRAGCFVSVLPELGGRDGLRRMFALEGDGEWSDTRLNASLLEPVHRPPDVMQRVLIGRSL